MTTALFEGQAVSPLISGALLIILDLPVIFGAFGAVALIRALALAVMGKRGH